MREKIFNEILKIYPSCHDLNHKWELTDQILALPVDGVQVTQECTNCKDKDFLLLRLLCPYCNNTGKIMRTLTIGEALEILPRMVTIVQQDIEEYCTDTCVLKVKDCKKTCFLFNSLVTKDGGIVEVKE